MGVPTEIPAQTFPVSNPVTPVTITYTRITGGGDGYKVKSDGTMVFIAWNNGTTGSATFTILSTSVPSWQNRKGDISKVLNVGEQAMFFIPSLGFNDEGWINFECSGAGASDVDVAIFKNM